MKQGEERPSGAQSKASPRPFAVFDIDGTLIRWQLYHAIVNQLILQGCLSEQVGQTIHEARMTWKRREHGESFGDYEHVLVDAYHRALGRVSVDDYAAAVDAVFDEYKDQVYTYTRDLIRKLKQQDYLLFIISGSHQEIIQKLGDYYGFDEVIGTRYEQKNGSFTGRLSEPYGHKADKLRRLVATHRATMTGSIAVGDSETDIEMLKLVEQPIAFNPSRGLFETARQHDWRIVVERKNMIYQMERRHGSYVLAEADS